MSGFSDFKSKIFLRYFWRKEGHWMLQGVVSTSLKIGYVLKSGVFGRWTGLFHKTVYSRKEWEADSFRGMVNNSALGLCTGGVV